MAVKRTWKVLEMGEGFEATSEINLGCPKCGYDAEMPYRPDPDNAVIASYGLSLIFDRPGRELPWDVTPDVVQCRKCRSIFVPRDWSDEKVKTFLEESHV